MIEMRTAVGILGSALVNLAGAESMSELFEAELEFDRLPGIVCLCHDFSDLPILRTPLLFVEASTRLRTEVEMPVGIAASGRPCPSEPTLGQLAEPRPTSPAILQVLSQAAPTRPSACAKISRSGVVLRAYLTREGASAGDAALLDALRSVRFEAARRHGRPVTAWHRVTVQAEAGFQRRRGG